MQRGVASKDHNGRETAGDNNPTSNEQAVNLNRSAVRSPAMSKSISVAQVKKEREQTSAGACSQFPSRLQRKHDGVASLDGEVELNRMSAPSEGFAVLCYATPVV